MDNEIKYITHLRDKSDEVYQIQDKDATEKLKNVPTRNEVPILDNRGKVSQDNLPSYVDDVVEYDSLDDFPNPGETGKIYVAKDTNYVYRWSGSTYIQIGGVEYSAGRGIRIIDGEISGPTYLGRTLSDLSESTTSNEIQIGTEIVTAEIGDIVLDKNSDNFYIWTGSEKWQCLGGNPFPKDKAIGDYINTTYYDGTTVTKQWKLSNSLSYLAKNNPYGSGTLTLGGDNACLQIGNGASASATGSYAAGYRQFSTSNQRIIASGLGSHAEGYIAASASATKVNITASGDGSHAEGCNTTASGFASHAEGRETEANTGYCHSEGDTTTSSGEASHTEGAYSSTGAVIETVTTIPSVYKMKMGHYYTTDGQNYSYPSYNTSKSLTKKTIQNIPTEEIGKAAHTEGYSNINLSNYGHVEGLFSFVQGEAAHAEGHNNKATGHYSHAEGYSTTASGNSSHSEGAYTVASKYGSHAEGYDTKAIGSQSHAEGYNTEANGDHSHAEGLGTYANNTQLVSGNYNCKLSGCDYDITSHIIHVSYIEGQTSYTSERQWIVDDTPEYVNAIFIRGEKNDNTLELTLQKNIDYTLSNNNYTLTLTSIALQKISSWSKVYFIEKVPNPRYPYSYYIVVGNGLQYERTNAYALSCDGTGHYAKDVYVNCNSDSTGGKKLATEEYVNEHGGGEGSNIFVANITYNLETETYESDKTIEDIQQAVSNNKAVIANFKGTTFVSASSEFIEDGIALFVNTNVESYYQCFVISSAGVNATNARMTPEVEYNFGVYKDGNNYILKSFNYESGEYDSYMEPVEIRGSTYCFRYHPDAYASSNEIGYIATKEYSINNISYVDFVSIYEDNGALVYDRFVCQNNGSGYAPTLSRTITPIPNCSQTTQGTYAYKCIVDSSGNRTYTWVLES